jgi:methylglutaconyl-CoA hydratase
MSVESAVVSSSDQLICCVDARGVARISINRPEVHNAWNPEVVAALIAAVAMASARPDVRVVVLTGEGKSFSAGGDLRWMRGILDLPSRQRRHDAMRIGDLLTAIDECPKPVIARVNGPAIGGGFGLVCACDTAISSDKALFGLSEVRLGIVPAMISPFVVRRLGEATARAHFLVGHDPMTAAEALTVGLIHRVVAHEDLDAAVEQEIQAVLHAAPGAVGVAKQLFRRMGTLALADAVQEAADTLSRIWEGQEAREGISAFLEKRVPSWRG